MLLSAYGRTCSAPARLSRGLLLAPMPSKVRCMQDNHMFCVPCSACSQVLHWGRHHVWVAFHACAAHAWTTASASAAVTCEQQCINQAHLRLLSHPFAVHQTTTEHPHHNVRMTKGWACNCPRLFFISRGGQGLGSPVQDAHSDQGWEGAGIEVPVTAAAAAAPASGSPAPTDCGSSSLAPVQLVRSPVLSGSSACVLGSRVPSDIDVNHTSVSARHVMRGHL